MSKYLEHTEAFPQAYGNEEEIGLTTDATGVMGEPYDFVYRYSHYIPQNQRLHIRSYRCFTTNGGLVYPDKQTADGEFTNLEITTPEVETPQQLVVYDKARQRLAQAMVSNYLEETGNIGTTHSAARLQRRVVDSRGSRKGTHDNFGIAEGTPLNPHSHVALPTPSILEHLSTRSFVTGAGFVKSNGWRFAQKIGGLQKIDDYGYSGSMYRNNSEDGSLRFEVRCGDINISDWAVLMRVGSMALVLAINQTPLGRDLNNRVFRAPEATLQQAKRLNRMRLDPDGGLTLTPEQRAAVDFQEEISVMAMDKLQLYIDDLPMHYYDIAKELFDYCQDFRKVLSGEEDVSFLADRADWAAKASIVLHGYHKDRSFGITRKLTDITARAQDMRYDYIGYQADGRVVAPPDMGKAYKLRAKGLFHKTVDEREVIKATTTPPNTRATLRKHLAETYDVVDCGWSRFRFTSARTDRAVDRKFEDVRQTELTEEDEAFLLGLKPNSSTHS